MKWLATLLFVVIMSTATAHAEVLDETVGEVSVPGNILWDVQGDMQGYIIYKIKETPNGYIAEVARDSEPHQFPVFTYTYDNAWNLVGKSNIQPKIDAPIPDVKPKPEPVPMPQVQPAPEPVMPEPEKPKPEKPEPPKPDPVKPPEETPPPVTPPEPTPGPAPNPEEPNDTV